MFIIIEIQEAELGGTPATLVYTEETKNEALSKWHDILKFACVSTIYRHSAVVMTTDGKIIARESYLHLAEESGE